MLFQIKEAARLEAKERAQQEEIAKLDQQLEQKRRKLRKMEELEVQLKSQLKSLTRRESGSGGGGSRRDNHYFGQQSPNSSLLHQGQHQGQPWMGRNLPGGPSPGNAKQAAFSRCFYASIFRSTVLCFLQGNEQTKPSKQPPW